MSDTHVTVLTVEITGKYLDKFLSRVIRGDGCWAWDGAHIGTGYAEGWDGVRPQLAHRMAYAVWVGPIPDGHEVDHLCHTEECDETARCSHRGCVNPAHLSAVPPRVNNLRSRSTGARNARKTHCSRNHPYDEQNTHVTPRGTRTCRACWGVRNRERWARRKLEAAA